LTVTDLREPQRSFAHTEVAAASSRPWPSRPVNLEVDVVGAGRVMDLDEFLALTSTTALVVVVDGVLVHERYFGGTTASDRLLGNSATKSALSLLTGLAVTSGALGDLDAPVTSFVPELSSSGYGSCSIRHVLTMTTGVDWSENYHDPDSQASQWLARMRRGDGGTRSILAGIRPGRPPGTSFNYCSPDSLVLDWVRERATGQTWAEVLAGLWSTIGAEHPAIVGLDGPSEAGGVAMAASSFAASARDWARIGALQVDGCWNGRPRIDPDWIVASSRAEQVFLEPGRLPSTITTHAGFGYHWWPLEPGGRRLTADGMRGQFVYVDRDLRTVVVKMSAWPYGDPWWDRQCRDLSYLGLPAIASAAAAAGAGGGAGAGER
jgi:CubicO group peptidase (beta-lactamase class C family)